MSPAVNGNAVLKCFECHNVTQRKNEQVPTGHLIEVVFLDVVNNHIRYEVLDTLPSSETTPGKHR